jgi:hypothetical protein
MYSRTTSLQSIYEEQTMDHNDNHIDNDLDVEKITYNKNDRSVGRRITVKCADAVLDWFVFPFLLFIQFGTTMYCQQQQDILTVQWEFAMCTISTFCIAAVGYRTIFRIHPIQSITLLLLPEIFTNIVLATVMFTNILNALYILIVLTFIIFIVATIGYIQVQQYKRLLLVPSPPPHASDYKYLHQEEHEEEDTDSDDEWVC